MPQKRRNSHTSHRNLPCHGGPAILNPRRVELYRDVWECDVIGMTNMPEAKLAREAEICYATVAMVTDTTTCWHPEHGEVDVALIIETLIGNSEKQSRWFKNWRRWISATGIFAQAAATGALEFAILTAPEKRDIEVVKKLRCIGGRVLNR